MFDLDEELSPYANTPEEADRESARHQLARMFPKLDEEEFIELEEGQLMRHTLNRVLDTMLHSKGPAFSMERVFDNDVFYQAKEEAYDLMLWLETEDDTPMPPSLKYKAPEEESSESNDEDSDTKISAKDSKSGPYNRRPRGVSSGSKYQQTVTMVRADLSSEVSRKDTITNMIEKFGLNKATAESYYSKAKAEIETAP